MRISNWLYAVILVTLAACTAQPAATLISDDLTKATSVLPAALAPSETPLPFELTSPAFAQGGTIPPDFACTGTNTSPQLDWNEPPAGTQSFAIILNDPDASSKGFVHWIVFNIPGDIRNLSAAIPGGAVLQNSAMHGTNSWGRMDYGGPCPPEGSTHNYVFTLYALDAMLELELGATKDELLLAVESHVLSEAELSATFSR